MSSIRIITYNIHRGRNWRGRLTLDRVADIIRLAQPDVVALQEVDVNRPSSGDFHQPKRLSEKTKMNYYFAPRLELEKGKYGLMFLSRYPLEVKRADPLHENKRKEKTIGYWAQFFWQNRSIQVINTHMGHGMKERKNLVGNLFGPDWLGDSSLKSSPTILCGDFNSTTWSPIYHEIQRHLYPVAEHKKTRTWPSFFPCFQIDHIFLSSHWRVKKTSSLFNRETLTASDHLPLVVDLELGR